MLEKISSVVDGAENLESVKKALINLFSENRKKSGKNEIGYVSGIIGSDGQNNIEINREALKKQTGELRKRINFPVFCAADLFTKDVFQMLEESRLETTERRKHFIKFWREVLEEGKITDVFMGNRWEESEGAKDEYDTALKLGLKIHIL